MPGLRKDEYREIGKIQRERIKCIRLAALVLNYFQRMSTASLILPFMSVIDGSRRLTGSPCTCLKAD